MSRDSNACACLTTTTTTKQVCIHSYMFSFITNIYITRRTGKLYNLSLETEVTRKRSRQSTIVHPLPLIIPFKFIITMLGLLPNQLIISTPSKQTVVNLTFGLQLEKFGIIWMKLLNTSPLKYSKTKLSLTSYSLITNIHKFSSGTYQ